jgi:hypothetical protein
LRYLRPGGTAFDRELLQFVRHFTSPGQIVLDVGANVGEFAIAACHFVGPSGAVSIGMRSGLNLGYDFAGERLQNQMFSPEDRARVRRPEQLLFLYLPVRPLFGVTRHFHRLVSR